MKKIILQITFLFAAATTLGQWTNLSSGTVQNLGSVFFLNDFTGFACGDSGKILKTVNGGASWAAIPSGISDESLVSISFPSGSTGYISGSLPVSGNLPSGVVFLKTTNAGNTWTNLSSNFTNSTCGGIWFTDDNTGFIAIRDTVASLSKILKTSDGGNSWNAVYTGTLMSWISYIYFSDANTGYATASNGYVLKTTDGGNTWNEIYMGGNYWMSGVYFFDANYGFVSGGGSGGAGDSPIWKTTDGGANWQVVYNAPPPGGISWIEFSDANTGFAVSASQTGFGTLLKTIDGGSTWLTETTPGDSLRTVHFPSSSVGYAVGKNGTIIRYGNLPTYSIYGTIYDQTHSFSLNNGTVYLLQYNSGSVQLAVDSFLLGGAVGDYVFSNHPAGQYLVFFRPDNSVYPNAIPTYYGDTMSWLGARIINLISDTSGIDIGTREVPQLSGSGFISGFIQFGTGSGKTGNGTPVPTGDPVPGVDISIEQIPGEIVKHTTTDNNGFYSFSNLPQSDYKLLVDIPGLGMDSTYTVKVTSSDSVFTNLDFVVDTTSDGTAGIYIGWPLGTAKHRLPTTNFLIFPNPNNGKFNLMIEQFDDLLLKEIKIYNVLGEIVNLTPNPSPKERGAQQLVIDISKHGSGVYFVQLVSEKWVVTKKVVVE